MSYDKLPLHERRELCWGIYTPYSPDFLFPKLEMKLKGLHFADVAEIQGAVGDELKEVKRRNFGTFQKV